MERRGYLAGTDSARASDFNEMFRDPEVHCVVCARGGYGSMRILDMIDYEAVRASRKVFVGYSDITALHLAIRKRAGLVTFHGPVVEAKDPERLNDYTVSHLVRAITSTGPLGDLANPIGVPAPSRPRWNGGGRAAGTLTGGNLSMVVSSIGTPFEIDTRDKILMLEEVSERPYRIDRMLRQLQMAGKLSSVAGVVLGEFIDCVPEAGKPTLQLDEIFAHYFGDLGVPVVSGLCCGHGKYRLTIPLGVRTEIDAATNGATLRVTEGACV